MKFQYYSNLLVNEIFKKEKMLFFLASLLNVYHLYTLNYIPSIDGPQHLYVANLIVNLLESNEIINQFFKFNHIIVGNWIGHFILAFYKFLFPASIAEKLLVTTYYFGIAYSFRYLIISIKGKSSFLSFIIFPFSTTTLVLSGYYNYSFGTVIFFLSLGYWVRSEQVKMNANKFFTLMTLFVLLFLSHAFVYMLAGLVFGLHYLLFFIAKIATTKNHRFILWPQLKKLVFLILAAIPSLFLWVNYMLALTDKGPSEHLKHSFSVLTDYLVIIRSLMVFSRQGEAPANVALFILVNILIIYSLLSRFIKYRKHKDVIGYYVGFFKTNDFWLFASFVFLVLYYTIPDKMVSGNISNRISIVMFFLLITWVGVQEFPRWLSVFLAISFISITAYQRVVFHKSLSILDKNIIELKELDRYIYPNKVIITMGAKKNWVTKHFAFYLGVDKSLVFLHDPQFAGQFPLVWNSEKIPPVYLGNKNVNKVKGEYLGVSGSISDQKIQIAEYVLINHPYYFFREKNNKELIEHLEKYYTKLSTTSHSHFALYEFKLHKEINRLVKVIENNKDWIKLEKEKAEKRGIPVENMVLIDALYSYDKNN